MLNSEWLLKMLVKSGDTPRGRLLALFDIVDDWIDAPHARNAAWITHDNDGRLLQFLTGQARLAGVTDPAVLAWQLQCLLLGAVSEELRRPGSGALQAAKATAATLLASRLTPPRRFAPAALAAGMVVAAILAGLPALAPSGRAPQPAMPHAAAPATQYASPLQPVSVSPLQVAALHQSLARVRQGDCQYPQALMLAAELRSVYLDSVVNGVVPTERAHLHQASQLMRQVECYYPPAAMTAL